MSNLHAKRKSDYSDFASKKALREALAADPGSVVFRDTSAFTNRIAAFDVDKVRPDDVVVGPCPNTNRRWYANVVTNARTGKITVR